MSGEIYPILIFWLIFIAFFYFFLIKPRLVEEKKRKELLKSLKKGDKVITTGGIIGTITRLEEEIVSLQVAEKVVIKFLRSSISTKIKESSEKGSKKSPQNSHS